jgi:hypothetical protein
MSKSINIINKTGKYLREISVIVIGVAITLSASQWINRQSEKRDVALYMNSMKMELEEIVADIDEHVIHYLEQIEDYAHYLGSHDKNSLHPDSIRHWGAGSIVSLIRNFAVQTTAFEMFKISGAMRLVEDKELLRDIWKAYNYLEMIQRLSDRFNQIKSDYADKETQSMDEGKSSEIPMYDFFIHYAGYGLLENCQAISELLKELIARLDETKN